MQRILRESLPSLLLKPFRSSLLAGDADVSAAHGNAVGVSRAHRFLIVVVASAWAGAVSGATVAGCFAAFVSEAMIAALDVRRTTVAGGIVGGLVGALIGIARPARVAEALRSGLLSERAEEEARRVPPPEKHSVVFLPSSVALLGALIGFAIGDTGAPAEFLTVVLAGLGVGALVGTVFALWNHRYNRVQWPRLRAQWERTLRCTACGITFLRPDLGSALKRLVRLSFRDGEVVDVLLLGADPVHDRDFVYEVRAVRREGTPKPKGTAVGVACVAHLDDLVNWELLNGTDAAV